jgi:cold-inducible RNA-binding protein
MDISVILHSTRRVFELRSAFIGRKGSVSARLTGLDLHMDNQQSTGSVQGNKLYVGGIPYRSTEDDLKKVFSEAGNVASASIISDRMTGRSRGFGFVEMATEAEAQAAIDRWDGKDMDGRTLSVSFARPQGDRPPRRENGFGGDRGGYGGNGGYGRGGY